MFIQIDVQSTFWIDEGKKGPIYIYVHSNWVVISFNSLFYILCIVCLTFIIEVAFDLFVRSMEKMFVVILYILGLVRKNVSKMM